MTSQPATRPSVGEYTLLTRLGEGGMGIVHLSRGRDGRRVALKVLRPQVVGDNEARQRLAREVASLERVRSPWIAEVLDADPWAEVPYVVTRYVPGLSLYDHVAEEGPVAGPDLMWLAGCLAEGVSAVHRAGVLHRDIKPSNVLMEGRTPILIDFGLARVADDPRLTQTGFLLGTPGYLAPEILYGDEPTPAADVHAWAATVAYAATGRAPYGKGPAMAILDRARRGQHDLSGIAEPLRGVLDAALAPEPLDRPLLDEILAWLRPLSTDPHAPRVAPPVRGALGTIDTGSMTRPYAHPTPTTTLIPELPELPETAPHLPVREKPTLPLTDVTRAEAMTRMETEWDQVHAPPVDVPAPAKASFGERLRRFVVTSAGALAVGGAYALAPWLALIGTLVVVWALRSGSLAVSAVADRRTVRGPKWYDGPRLVVTSPWHVVRAVPGAVVLLAWALLVGAAAGLVGYATADVAAALFVGGSGVGLGLWTGPDSIRFRSPVNRLLHPAARTAVPWVLTCFVLLALAALLTVLAQMHGTDWVPATSGPFGL